VSAAGLEANNPRAFDRVPEPELMDDPEQARAYSDADFAEAHDAFVAHIHAKFGAVVGVVLDAGCGSADPTVRFALANPGARVVGVDAGVNMLALGRARVAAAGLADRVALEHRRLPDESLLERRFDAVISNSLLHHLLDPLTLWQLVARCARPGAPVAVMDLARPVSRAAVDALVARYAGDAPPVLQRDFRNSLCAAYREREVASQLEQAGLPGFAVEQVSDRHLLVHGRGTAGR
jgi:SAM-dependent methyltransferase